MNKGSLIAAGLLAGMVAAPAAGQAPAVSYEVLHHFDRPPLRSPYAGLLVHSNGSFYGAFADGALYRYEPTTGALKILHTFSGPDGASPQATVIEGPGGALFGTTYFGGANGRGTIFRYDVATSSLTTLFSFGVEAGFPNAGLVLASDGRLYGVAGTGGQPGALFRFDLATATFAILHTFGTTDGWPAATLIQAADGALYGATGVNSSGVIFRFDPATSAYQALHVFAGTDGRTPYGALFQAADGLLYGTTTGGGANGLGTLFRINPTTAAFAVLHHFDGATGARPYASLRQGGDGALYGTTSEGGAAGGGTVFRYDLSTSSLATVVTFDGANGKTPRAELAARGDGSFVGTAVGGGLGLGTIYRFVPGSTGVTTMHAFRGAGGATPSAGLVEGLDGAIYGTTLDGAAGGQGTLFRYDRSSGFAELLAFDGARGARPRGDLLRAPDGTLYGTTTRGGAHDGGTLFRYVIPTADWSVLHSFGGAFDAGPSGALAQGQDTLYGTTNEAAGGRGTIYRFDVPSATVTTLHSFPSPDGGSASGVIKGADGALYGTVPGLGSPSSRGQLFRCDVATVPATVSILRIFSPGEIPFGGVVETADGSLWGPHQPGAGGVGRLYRYRPATGTYAVPHFFSGPDGDTPTGALIIAADGALYGTTVLGGSAGLGTVFRFDPNGTTPRTAGNGVHTVLWTFHGADGSRPVARLLQASDGAIYGTTSGGGAFGGGVLFRLKVGRQ